MSGYQEQIKNLLQCPICRCMMNCPRMFSCGHTMCTPCHKQYDSNIESRAETPDVIVYHCPICRKETLSPCKYRSINYALNDIIKTHPDYIDLGYEHETYDIDLFDTNVDIDKIATRENMSRAKSAYELIMPTLISAAHKGLLRVTISNSEILKKIAPCFKHFSKLLLDRNNIFMIEYNAEDNIDIYLTEDGLNVFTMRRQYQNSFTAIDVDSETEIEDVSLSVSSIDSIGTSTPTRNFGSLFRSSYNPPWAITE